MRPWKDKVNDAVRRTNLLTFKLSPWFIILHLLFFMGDYILNPDDGIDSSPETLVFK
jgi:hypothetical protein